MLYKFMADSMTRPGNTPVFGSPADFAIDFEDVSFEAEDGVRLSGWLLKGGKDRIILFFHFGIQSSRSGYTPEGKPFPKPYPKKIEFLRTMKHLVDNGYSVLMIDQRNHGNSGEGTNAWIAGGDEESKDVLAAVNFVSGHPDHQKSKIGLMGYCQGANAVTYAFGRKNGLRRNKQIKAFVAVQPLYSFATFMRAYGFPNGMVKNANDLHLGRGGVDLYKSAWEHIEAINVPTLVVQGEKDPWTDMVRVREYYDRLQVEKEMVWLEGARHRFNGYEWFGHTPGIMLHFFKNFMQ